MSDKPASSDRRPLWQQVLEDLEHRIAAGEITGRFPTDKELTERYGVSRHTVREAVSKLRARGLVDRHRGRGSFLNEAMLTQPMGGLYSLFQAVEEAGLEQRSEVLTVEVTRDAATAARLELPADASLVRLERLRYAGGEPLAVDESWLPEAVGRPLLEVDLSRAALYDVLGELSDVRLTAADETLTPVVPDRELVDLLGLDPEEALLRVERLAATAQGPVEWRVTLIRGERFRYTSSWHAEDAAPPTTAFVDAGRPSRD